MVDKVVSDMYNIYFLRYGLYVSFLGPDLFLALVSFLESLGELLSNLFSCQLFSLG